MDVKNSNDFILRTRVRVCMKNNNKIVGVCENRAQVLPNVKDEFPSEKKYIRVNDMSYTYISHSLETLR